MCDVSVPCVVFAECVAPVVILVQQPEISGNLDLFSGTGHEKENCEQHKETAMCDCFENIICLKQQIELLGVWRRGGGRAACCELEASGAAQQGQR
jgi:hypothetical protein